MQRLRLADKAPSKKAVRSANTVVNRESYDKTKLRLDGASYDSTRRLEGMVCIPRYDTENPALSWSTPLLLNPKIYAVLLDTADADYRFRQCLQLLAPVSARLPNGLGKIKELQLIDWNRRDVEPELPDMDKVCVVVSMFTGLQTLRINYSKEERWREVDPEKVEKEIREWFGERLGSNGPKKIIVETRHAICGPMWPRRARRRTTWVLCFKEQYSSASAIIHPQDASCGAA